MGERTTGLIPREPAELEHDVERLRRSLTTIVSELDHRRHELLDWRGQLKRHAPKLAVAAGACALLIGGAVALGVMFAHRANRPAARARRLRDQVMRVVQHPELLTQRRESVARRVMLAAAGALAGVVAKELGARALLAARTGGPRAFLPASAAASTATIASTTVASSTLAPSTTSAHLPTSPGVRALAPKPDPL